MADINKLKDKIKSTIYPNGKGAINASDHQAMLLDMADGMAETDTKLATLSAGVVTHFGAKLPYGGAAYTNFPCRLYPGMTIVSLGVSTAVYLKTKDGKTFNVYTVPYTIEEDIVAFQVNTTNEGTLIFTGDYDVLKKDVASLSEKVEDYDGLKEKISSVEIDITELADEVTVLRQDAATLSSATYAYGGAAYTDIPCRLYQGMTLTDIGVTTAVYLKKKSGGTINVYYNQIPFAIPEEIVAFQVNTTDEGEIIAMGETAETIKNLEATVKGLSDSLGNAIRVKYASGKVYIASAWDAENELVREVVYDNLSANKNINLEVTYISKKGKYEKSTIIKSCGEDICPFFVNGSYIAANHGWNTAKNVVVASHDKTAADIGAIYVDDAGVKFTLLEVKDSNTLIFCSENTSTEAYNYRFLPPTGKLTYVSNGKSKSAVNFTSYSNLGNLYGCIVPSTKKMFVDGVAVVSAGIYEGANVTLMENYDVMDMPSVLAALTANRPSGGYSSLPTYYELNGVERLYNVTNAYKFEANGVTLVNTTIRAYKPLYLGYFGVTQALVADGNVKLYCPKTLPIQVGSTTYDLRKITTWMTAPTADILMTPTYWENAESAPDRAVMLNDIATFSCGYLLDRGKLAEPRKDLVNKYAMHFSTTRKLYPMGVCKTSPILMQSGEYYSMVAYRTYGNKADNPPQRTHYSAVPIDNAIYLYVDYHGAIEDYLPCNPQWVGKKITVVEKNDRCNVYEDVVTGDIRIDSTATANEYGYIVLKLE